VIRGFWSSSVEEEKELTFPPPLLIEIEALSFLLILGMGK